MENAIRCINCSAEVVKSEALTVLRQYQDRGDAAFARFYFCSSTCLAELWTELAREEKPADASFACSTASTNLRVLMSRSRHRKKVR